MSIKSLFLEAKKILHRHRNHPKTALQKIKAFFKSHEDQQPELLPYVHRDGSYLLSEAIQYQLFAVATHFIQLGAPLSGYESEYEKTKIIQPLEILQQMIDDSEAFIDDYYTDANFDLDQIDAETYKLIENAEKKLQTARRFKTFLKRQIQHLEDFKASIKRGRPASYDMSESSYEESDADSIKTNSGGKRTKRRRNYKRKNTQKKRCTK